MKTQILTAEQMVGKTIKRVAPLYLPGGDVLLLEFADDTGAVLKSQGNSGRGRYRAPVIVSEPLFGCRRTPDELEVATERAMLRLLIKKYGVPRFGEVS